jgi:hypothetical protein
LAHFAELDENNIVTRVLVTDNSFTHEGYDWLIDTLGGTWIQTSYNASIRFNFAGIGFSYDPELDAFIAPQPYESWVLVEQTAQWTAPVPYPTDGLMYSWDEAIIDWVASELQMQGPVN